MTFSKSINFSGQIKTDLKAGESTSNSIKSDDIDWKSRYLGELEKRRALLRELTVEKDRSIQLQLQVTNQQGQINQLYQQIGGLEYQLNSQKTVIFIQI